jgi:murein DD-endopeptidase MepM/ murein hydrolase activator NlpD
MEQRWLYLSRRRFLALAGAAGVATFVRTLPAAAAPLVDPYQGVVPLAFPLRSGSYRTPVTGNWHVGREGARYPWSHRDGANRRAHDGVDLYPSDPTALPLVYAPFHGTIAAIGLREDNTLDAATSYRVSTRTPPPWDYTRAIDTVANLPLYGNFVWLVSSEAASNGYYVLYAHLQHDDLIAHLQVDQPVGPATPVGRMGDTGNAAGVPQLHVELHYPLGSTYRCRDCSSSQTLTSIDPTASLLAATPHP